jgi:alpha-beta hydrolase superfamily lysophospholipase
MNILEFSRQAKDNTTLYFKEYLPKFKIEAVVCIVHGLGDHSGLFSNLIDYFINKNYAVLTIDLRGHGKSEGTRGHIPSYEAILSDLDILLAESQRRFNNTPIFFYGHSFGGNLVINYVLRHHKKISGVIATAPWLSLTNNPSTFKLLFLSVLNKLSPKSSIGLDVVDSSALSHKPGLEERYKNDPLVHDKVTSRLFLNAYKAGLWGIKHASNLDVPLLLMHGTDDTITSPEASQKFAENTSKNLCELKLWGGLYHSLHNEIDNHELYSYVNNWIQNIVSSNVKIFTDF